MSLTHDRIRFEGMCPDECRRLLGTKQVGRLAFVSNGNPDVQPVNYALDGDTVVFATGTGTKLWAATRAPVAFEVDDIDSSTRSGWSVVIHGLAQEITALDTTAVRERMEALPLSPWPGGGRTTIVRLPATSITGRRVGERAAV